jgi:hypothetical protein
MQQQYASTVTAKKGQSYFLKYGIENHFPIPNRPYGKIFWVETTIIIFPKYFYQALNKLDTNLNNR